MKFSILAESLNKMELTSKRLELTQYLVELFENTPQDVVSQIVYLLQGKLRPDFEGVELGVAEKLAIKAISKSSGITIKKIEGEYRKTGDLGQAATKILEQKTQTTFLVENITVERVYETLFKIAKLEGPRSQDMKMKYISSLLNDATPLEARYILKILTAGEGAVGKTTLLHRYVEGMFTSDTKMTIGVEFFMKELTVEKSPVTLQLWDFGGQERFRFLLENYVYGAKGALLLFDLTRFQTVKNLESWVSILRKFDPNLPILFVGTKLDLEDLVSIDDNYALDLLKQYNFFDFIKISSKLGYNVELTFELIVRKIIGLEYTVSNR